MSRYREMTRWRRNDLPRAAILRSGQSASGRASGCLVLLAAAVCGGSAMAEPMGLGREATPEEVAAWDIDVRPDGQGLPEGEGDVMTGEMIYTERCSSCHGIFGEGEGRWPILMGGSGTLDQERPVKTVGSYWPYASTVWDYIHRAMPFGDAQSLSPDEVYAVAAYVLYLNDVVDDDFVASADTYAAIELPNADGFIPDDREATELALFSGEPCMTDCKEHVEITMHAAVLDVTPDGAGMDLEGAAIAPGPAETAPEGEASAMEPAGTDDMEVAAAEPALVEQGKALFPRCRACHEVGEDAGNRVGPHLNGVLGREAASVEGFDYSPAMREMAADGLTWNADKLADFLIDPRSVVPGTRMVFPGLTPEDAKAMAAYLGALPEEG